MISKPRLRSIKTHSELDKVNVMRVDTSQFKKGLRRALKTLERFRKQVERFRKQMERRKCCF